LSHLTNLSLASCPVAYFNNYRRRVISRVPTLSLLDDCLVSPSDSVAPTEEDEAASLPDLPAPLAADLAAAQSARQASAVRSGRPSSALARPTSARPLTTSSGVAAHLGMMNVVPYQRFNAPTVIAAPVRVSERDRRGSALAAPASPAPSHSLRERLRTAPRSPDTGTLLTARLGTGHGGEDGSVGSMLQSVFEQQKLKEDAVMAGSDLTTGGCV
jgi:hypothetical protein